jgi:sterol 3beta-glucosyltransferase
MGVGVWIRKLNVESLSSALKSITTDEKMQERAKVIGERIRKENGVQTAIKMLYRDLDYARERINRIADKHQK